MAAPHAAHDVSMVDEVANLPLEELAAQLDAAGIPSEPGVDRQQMEYALRAHTSGDVPRDAASAFAAADIDRSGDLDAREVSLLMATCGMLLGPEALRAAFEEMDTDGDGTISSAELEVWWAAEVAPNLEINERTAQLQQVAATAAGARTLQALAPVRRSLSLGPVFVLLPHPWGRCSSSCTPRRRTRAGARRVDLDGYARAGRPLVSAELCADSPLGTTDEVRGKSVSEVFDALDADRSGALDVSEVQVLAAKLGLVMATANAEEMLRAMDTDGDGEVSKEEFVSWWQANVDIKPEALQLLEEEPAEAPAEVPAPAPSREETEARRSRSPRRGRVGADGVAATAEREARRAATVAKRHAREAERQKLREQVHKAEAERAAASGRETFEAFLPAAALAGLGSERHSSALSSAAASSTAARSSTAGEELPPAPPPEPPPPALEDKEWTECCCGYLQKQLEPGGSRFTRRWYSLETGSEGGLRLSYTMAPPEQDEPAVSPTAERLRRRKER